VGLAKVSTSTSDLKTLTASSELSVGADMEALGYSGWDVSKKLIEQEWATIHLP